VARGLVGGDDFEDPPELASASEWVQPRRQRARKPPRLTDVRLHGVKARYEDRVNLPVAASGDFSVPRLGGPRGLMY